MSFNFNSPNPFSKTLLNAFLFTSFILGRKNSQVVPKGTSDTLVSIWLTGWDGSMLGLTMQCSLDPLASGTTSATAQPGISWHDIWWPCDVRKWTGIPPGILNFKCCFPSLCFKIVWFWGHTLQCLGLTLALRNHSCQALGWLNLVIYAQAKHLFLPVSK